MVLVLPGSSADPDRPSPRETGKVLPHPPARRFVTTRWSLVLDAGHPSTPQAREALSELCALYWPPLHAFIQRQGYTAEVAKDLTQGFFTRLLEKDALAAATPHRGRFRAWLMASARHYLANEWDRSHALMRGGDRVHLPLEDGEGNPLPVPAPGLTPEQAYERCWAERLLARVLAALREEYASDGRGPLFDRLKPTLTGASEDAYAVIAGALGMKAGAVKTAACRLRTRYRERLHEEVRHTVEKPEDVADELRFLIGALEGL